MALQDRPKQKYPLHLGCIVVRHHGCWAADTTRKFPSITLEIAVTGYDTYSYELYVIITPKNGELDEVTREQIAGFINLHRLVVPHSIIMLQSDRLMVMHLRVVDGGGPSGVIRPVVMFGSIMTEICHHVEDGRECVWGLYEDKDAFDRCCRVSGMIYGNDRIVASECWFSDNPGLVNGPKIFSETILGNMVKLDEQRAMIDQYLHNGAVEDPDLDTLPEKFYRKLRDLAPAITKIVGAVLAKELIDLLRSILFPQLPPIDP